MGNTSIPQCLRAMEMALDEHTWGNPIERFLLDIIRHFRGEKCLAVTRAYRIPDTTDFITVKLVEVRPDEKTIYDIEMYARMLMRLNGIYMFLPAPISELIEALVEEHGGWTDATNPAHAFELGRETR